MILIASIVFIYFFVPETKNRSFDDNASSIGCVTPYTTNATSVSFGRVKKKQPFHEDGEEMKAMEMQDNGEEIQPLGV